mgnify:CR=1 FL=1
MRLFFIYVYYLNAVCLRDEQCNLIALHAQLRVYKIFLCIFCPATHLMEIVCTRLSVCNAGTFLGSECRGYVRMPAIRISVYLWNKIQSRHRPVLPDVIF